MTQDVPGAKSTIKGLNAFRWFAFLGVFLYHSSLLPAGYLGVQAFFVLSGFLITPILVRLKSEQHGATYFGTFFGRRALRIFPVYYLYLLVVVVLVFAFNEKLGLGDQEARLTRQLPWALTYSYNFLHASSASELSPFLVHFWSLAVEEQFYLVWPLLLYVVPVHRIRAWLLAIILLGPALRLGTIWWVGEAPQLFNPDVNLAVYCLPLTYLDAFAIGGYFALYERSRGFWLPAIVLALAFFLAMAVNKLTYGKTDWYSFGYPSYFRGGGSQMVWGYTLLSVAFAMALASIRQGDFLPALFNLGPLDYLGKISYGCYVFHLPLVALAIRVEDMHRSIPIAIALVSTVVVSAASYEFFEKRFLARKDRLFPNDATATPAPRGATTP